MCVDTGERQGNKQVFYLPNLLKFVLDGQGLAGSSGKLASRHLLHIAQLANEKGQLRRRKSRVKDKHDLDLNFLKGSE